MTRTQRLLDEWLAALLQRLAGMVLDDLEKKERMH